MCQWGTTEVLVGHTNSRGGLINVDKCLAPIIKALNDAGVRTAACCCGHGKMPGNVMLADGREIVIMPDHKTARRVEALMIEHGLARPIN